MSVLVRRCVALRVDGGSSFVDSSVCVFVVVGGRRLVVPSSILGESSLLMISGLEELAAGIVGESSLPLRAVSGLISDSSKG